MRGKGLQYWERNCVREAIGSDRSRNDGNNRMLHLRKIGALPPRALGFGLWWMWIYLALLSPTFSQSPLVAPPSHGAALNFATIVSGAAVFLVAIPLASKMPALFRHRATAFAAAAIASCSTVLMAFSAMFGAWGHEVLIAGSLMAGVGISVLYLQWGIYYSTLTPKVATSCTVLAFLLAIVLAALVLDRGILTTVVTVAAPLLGASLIPFDELRVPGAVTERETGSWDGAHGAHDTESAESPKGSAALRAGLTHLFPASVVALISAFSFAFGLFRVLLSVDGPSPHDMGLLLLCSAVMALAMLVIIVAFSVSLGWDSIIYLALPLVAAAALVLSLVDFGDRPFVWAIIVAAVRVADLITWMIFANAARASRRNPVTVFAVGKLIGQIGALAGLAVGELMRAALDVESLLLPTALAFLVIVTVFGSIAAIRGRVEESVAKRLGASGAVSSMVDEAVLAAEQSAEEARIRGLAHDYGLSPREAEIFGLLAKGRTVPYIAEELTLANSTVTTHVRGLYRKLDVHNRQELLDFVERSH